MIKPYNAIDDEQDPYKGWSDSNQVSADTPPEQREVPKPDDGPKPYTPPAVKTAEAIKPGDPQPQRTFAQMEAEGQARPPMPTSASLVSNLVNAPQVADETGMVGGMMPPGQIDGSQFERPSTPPMAVPGDPEPTIADETGMVGHAEGTPPASGNAILDLLTGGATGLNKSDLTKATEAKAMDRLNSASPYDSNAVRDEYNWLGGNIDDQYAMDSRALDEGMAARGLYGSSGKDFHSGRLADLNVGKRSAKESLAQDLATKYATTKGQYDANALDQAQSVGAQGDAQQRAWQQLLQSFGNDAFNHDLAGAEFGQRQNESEQDFLLRMLQMGYGV